MIKVEGGKIELDGSDITIQKELSFLIKTFHSRIASRGNGALNADEMIDTAVTDASLYTLDYLRSESRMYAPVGMPRDARKAG